MKTRSSRRPLAAAALAIAVVLASGTLARSEAAGSAHAGRHGGQPAVQSAGAPAFSAIQQWMNRVLAAIGRPPVATPTSGLTSTVPPPTAQTDNGAGIDPNG